MVRLTIGVCLLALAGCSSIHDGCGAIHDERLIGRWQSDKDATLAILTAHVDLSGLNEKQRETLDAIFGKLIVTYDRRRVHTRLEDYEESFKYKVIAKNTTGVVIESPDTLGLGDQFKMIRFEGKDKYYLFSQYLNFPEVFKRLQ